MTKVAELNGRGSMSKTGVKVRTEQVSPAVAEKLLAENHRNRNLRTPIVARLAGAMQRGEWEMNGETVKVAETGSLLDGQHRLAAIVASGVTVPLLVVRGLPEQAQETIDTGAARSPGDVLRLRGEQQYAILAAAVRSLWTFRENATFQERFIRPTTQQIVALLEEHGSIRSSVPFATRVVQYVRIPPGPFTTLHYLFSLADHDAAGDFFDRLATGEGLLHEDPVRNLRNQLIRDAQYARQAPRHAKAAWTIKAWNAWRAGERLARLQWQANRGERFPSIDGLPDDFFGGEPVTGSDLIEAASDAVETTAA